MTLKTTTVIVRSWVVHAFPFWSQVRDGGLICCLMPRRLLVGDTTPMDPVVMAPFQGSNSWSFSDSAGDPEEVSVVSPSSSSIVTDSSRSMMKWWVTALSGPKKLDDGKPRRSRKLRRSLT
ncbi:hypothetical protein EVAR_93659_1 [Eumeta japonica]|uniref:Uncharacterized protein n=1 Tax=Eumeta variegata TaxID=151549 RepID=A0A4C1TQN0_EUMVA|nr:hypothetical protein EVAR_93659_1 [Eumeta japonica]